MAVWGFVDVVVVLVLVASTGAQDCCQNYCNKPTSVSGTLSFTGGYHKKHIEVVRQKFYLDCCSSGPSTVNTTWYKWESVMWKTEHVPEICDDEVLRYPCEHGQILLFHEADKISDSGLYRCEVTDGQVVLVRNFTVIVFECVRDQPDYLLIEEQPEPALQVAVGRAFHQKCQVQFGCYQAAASDSNVWWTYKGSDGAVHNISSEGKEHYHVHEAISVDNTSKTVVLTVDQVLEADLHTELSCTAAKGNKSATFTITLHQPASDRRLQTVLIVVFASIGGTIVLCLLTVLVLYVLWGPTIQYRLLSGFSKLPQRTGKKYDVMVVGGEEHADAVKIANTLREQLQQKNYRVYRLQPGKSEIQEVDDIPKCVTVIIVIKDIKMSADRYLGVVTETHCNVIFIVPDSFKDSEWTEVSQDYAKVYRNISGLYTVLRWPGGFADKSDRRCTNFWSKVQRSLPMVDVKAAKRDTDEPLIEGHTQEYNKV